MRNAIKKQTFCELTAKMSADELEAYVKLVKDPCVICRRCARLASKKRNLCRPRKITKGKKK